MAETVRSVHFAAAESPQDLANTSRRTTADDGNADVSGPSGSSTLTRDDPRSADKRKREEKIGHRRVDSETGEVTYKRVPTSNLMGAIQLGVATMLGANAQELDRDLLLQDFAVVDKLSFPSEGSAHTPSHTYGDFRFIAYAPYAFRYFRNLFNIQLQDFLSSICAEPLVELSNPGASGSIFYLTNDDEFIIKTVQMKEAEFLQKLLPGYYMNISKNIRLLVMNNLLPTTIKMHQKYDLKGSTYKRQASRRERAKECPTLKDLDFLEENPDGLKLEAATYDALMRTISRDCLVLESYKIMDYSMLIGIHNLDTAAADDQQASTSGLQERQIQHAANAAARARKYNRQKSLLNAMESIQATTSEPIDLGDEYPYGIPARNVRNERLLLFVGIIDILQYYRFLKKFEHAWKSVLHDGDTISVHRPPFYSERFQDFMKKNVFHKTQSPLKHSPSRRRSRKSVSASGNDYAADDGPGTPSNLMNKRKSLTRQDNVPDFVDLNQSGTPGAAQAGATPGQLLMADRPSTSRRAPERLFAPTPPPEPTDEKDGDADAVSPVSDPEEVRRDLRHMALTKQIRRETRV